MARDINQITVTGYVGKDPEIRYTTSGVAVANFSIAVNEVWKDKDGNKQERTQWFNVQAWSKLAETVGEYVKKGTRLLVQGRMQSREYEKDGVKHYPWDLVLSNFIFMGGSQATNAASPAPTKGNPRKNNDKEDDLPF